MNSRQRRLAQAAYTLYGWAFVVSGLAGVLLSHLEPTVLHRLVVLPEQRDAIAGLVHQLRFLRGAELGFGLVMLAAKDSFFTPADGGARPPLTRALLAGLFAAPAARTVSLLLDGPPAPLWTGLLVVEWGLFLLLRRASEPRRPASEPPTSSPTARPAPGQDDAPETDS